MQLWDDLKFLFQAPHHERSTKAAHKRACIDAECAYHGTMIEHYQQMMRENSNRNDAIQADLYALALRRMQEHEGWFELEAKRYEKLTSKEI